MRMCINIQINIKTTYINIFIHLFLLEKLENTIHKLRHESIYSISTNFSLIFLLFPLTPSNAHMHSHSFIELSTNQKAVIPIKITQPTVCIDVERPTPLKTFGLRTNMNTDADFPMSSTTILCIFPINSAQKFNIIEYTTDELELLFFRVIPII